MFEVVELTKEAKKGKEGAKELLEARVFQDFGMAIQVNHLVLIKTFVNPKVVYLALLGSRHFFRINFDGCD